MDIYKTVDKQDPDWLSIYMIAQEDQTHWLWENYQKIDLDTYEHMIVNLRNNEPAAFHGIYNNGRWPKNVSRICNRAYINPKFRDLGEGLEITWKNIKYVLDNYNIWNKEVLFISRGVQYDNIEVSWKKFQKFCKFLIKNTGYELKWDNRLYQCCLSECKDCYQFAVWYDPKNLRDSLEIKSISQQEWIRLPNK
jgi:hypothetical protein